MVALIISQYLRKLDHLSIPLTFLGSTLVMLFSSQAVWKPAPLCPTGSFPYVKYLSRWRKCYHLFCRRVQSPTCSTQWLIHANFSYLFFYFVKDAGAYRGGWFEIIVLRCRGWAHMGENMCSSLFDYSGGSGSSCSERSMFHRKAFSALLP